MADVSTSEVWHASAVAVEGQALVCVGKSGSGKSSTCLELIGLGAILVGDDRVEISVSADGAVVRPVAEIAGLIEARGLGLLNADHVAQANLAYVLDLEAPPAPRLPEPEFRDVLGHHVPLLRPIQGPHRFSALYQLLKFGRNAP